MKRCNLVSDFTLVKRIRLQRDQPSVCNIASPAFYGARAMQHYSECLKGVACDCHMPSRRSVIAGLACSVVVPQAASAFTRSPAAEDQRFMRMAIDEGRAADLPFGAVIVHAGGVIARGGNHGRSQRDPTAHGEMVAIRNAVDYPGADALKGATLYTTGEPCPMCMGAIVWCGISRVVYAASITQLATVMDQIMVPSTEIAARETFAPVSITGGVLADEVMALFREKMARLAASARP
jgi:tRNA(Arg) A34 adenosine deaminase TadA